MKIYALQSDLDACFFAMQNRVLMDSHGRMVTIPGHQTAYAQTGKIVQLFVCLP